MQRYQRVLVESEGVVLLPESFREELGLRPGDLLSVEGQPPPCFSLAPYRDLLAVAPQCMTPDTVRSFALLFLSHPLAAVDADLRIVLPPEPFPLPAGSRLTLFLDGDDAEGHRLQVFVNIQDV